MLGICGGGFSRDFRYTSPMSFLGDISAPVFIRQYWQRHPLVMRGVLPDSAALMTGDELAGIACQDDAEARIITARDETWTCESGPFAESRFADLPATGWTLLVQAVDQWVPKIAALLEHFAFLPRWRLDDIMISYAVDGGGVGPHFDYYDVFLLQASGARQWRIGQHCDASTPLQDHPDLRLLRDFETLEKHVLNTGDLLYVPAGRAHWGIAAGDDSITISIGFRAPSHRDLILGAAEVLAEGPADSARYCDTEASIDTDPYLINAAATQQALAAWPGISNTEPGDTEWKPPSTALRTALTHALGVQSTEPRYPEHIEAAMQWTADALNKWLARGGQQTIEHHRASRFAYHIDSDGEQPHAHLYVDGQRYTTTVRLARGLCHGRIMAEHVCDPRERELLLSLINAGSVSIRPR